MDGVKRVREMQKSGAGWVLDAQVATMERTLRQIARDDRVQNVKESPDRRYLFNKYLKPTGYEVFSVLSELGSHAGFFHAVLFHLDPDSKQMDVNYGGGLVERAMWIASGFEFFGYTTDEVGKAFGWDDWLRDTVLPIVQRAAPSMRDVRARWQTKWSVGDAVRPV
jgi:hypothetical protein